jgi:dihydroorotase
MISNKNGMHPAQMCRPVLKSERHVDALTQGAYYAT